MALRGQQTQCVYCGRMFHHVDENREYCTNEDCEQAADNTADFKAEEMSDEAGERAFMRAESENRDLTEDEMLIYGLL